MQTLHTIHLIMTLLRINRKKIEYNAVLAITGTIRGNHKRNYESKICNLEEDLTVYVLSTK